MEQVICQRCGSIDDYETTKSGPHVKAICNSCGKYIKFLSQSKTKPMAEKSQDENPLPEGLRFFNPHENAPDFVIASLVITPADLVAFIKENAELLTEYEGKKQLRLQVLKSKGGNIYARVDNYKKDDSKKKEPAKAKAKEASDDDLPF